MDPSPYFSYRWIPHPTSRTDGSLTFSVVSLKEKAASMASVFLRGRDRGKRRPCYDFSYDDENGVRRTKRGFTEKRATVELAQEIERKVKRTKEGLIEPDKERHRKASRLPIHQHLSVFERSLKTNSEKHVKLTMSRIRKIVEGGKIRMLREFTPEQVESFLIDFQEEEDIGPRTYNLYAQAVDAFANWLVETKRMISNPLVGLKRMHAATEVRHKRRAVTHEEVITLVESARSSGKSIQAFDGEQRARVYILSYMTGLRRLELASLSPESFYLDSEQPTLTIEAACSKHRRKDLLPLHPELVSMLRRWSADAESEPPIFPNSDKKKTWFMVMKDLERTGIPDRTNEGVADFHATKRHSHITELVRSGASLREVQKLARHSDVRITMRYTHIGMDDQANGLGQLAWSYAGDFDSHAGRLRGTVDG